MNRTFQANKRFKFKISYTVYIYPKMQNERNQKPKTETNLSTKSKTNAIINTFKPSLKNLSYLYTSIPSYNTLSQRSLSLNTCLQLEVSKLVDFHFAKMEQILNPFLKPDEYYEYEPKLAPRNELVPSYMRSTRSSELKKRKKSISVHQQEPQKDEDGWNVLESSSVRRSLLKSYEDEICRNVVLDSSWLTSTCPEDPWFVEDSSDERIASDEAVSEASISAFTGDCLASDSAVERTGIANPVMLALLAEDSAMEPETQSRGDSIANGVDHPEARPWITLIPTAKKRNLASEVKYPSCLRPTASSSRKRRPKSPRRMQYATLFCV